ncbi:MAG: hypothetical protein COA84_11030 [Robiginitomaculum sp.]|nr:MAG: hypothetical protein COA84_11030 [Robiginitomaculum sp.]
MSIFRTLALLMAPFLLLNAPAGAAQAQQSIAQLEVEYDAVDSRLFAMRDFTRKTRREGADLVALARALGVMGELDGQLVILRNKLNALRAGAVLIEEGATNKGEAIEDDEGFETLEEFPQADEDIDLTGNAGALDDAGDELWDALEADADANPGDYVYEEQNTEVATTEGGGDGWDSVDEIDGDVVGYVDENQINAMRNRMAQQSASDKNRISANARNEYANVQAERRRAREEYLRRQAQQRAELAATLQAFANQMNAENQPVSPPPLRSSTPVSRSSGGSSGGGMTNAQYQRLLKQCMDAKYAKARNSGFPIMDPNGPRIQCNSEIRRRMQGSSGSSSSNRTVRNSGGGQSAGGGDQCQAVAKGSKNPKRWYACCKKGGEIRYNAFTVPDGSRTGLSAYRCMQKGRPDEVKYRIAID